MSPAKQAVRELLDRLPDEATIEDIQYHLYVMGKIERSQRDIDAGRVFTPEEAEEKLSKWLRP